MLWQRIGNDGRRLDMACCCSTDTMQLYVALPSETKGSEHGRPAPICDGGDGMTADGAEIGVASEWNKKNLV